MIEQFRQNRLGVGVLLFIAALLVRVFLLLLVNSNPLPIENIGLFEGAIQWINSHWHVSMVLSFLLIIFQSYLVNSICISSGALQGSGILGTYFFLLLNTLFLENVFFSIVQIGNLFILLGLNFLFRLKECYDTRLLFYSAILFGIGILFIPDHIWIFVFEILGILIFKAIVFKDVIALVLGLIMPLYITKSLWYLFSLQSAEIGNLEVVQLSLQSLLSLGFFPNADYIVMGIFLLASLLGLFQQIGSYFNRNIEARISISLNALFFAYCLLMLLLHWRNFAQFHMLISIPSTFLLVNFFNEDRISLWKRFINLLLLVLALFSMFGRFLI